MERTGRLVIVDGSIATMLDRKEGVYSYIAFNDRLSRVLLDIYGREGLCLKVFKHGGLVWGDNSLIDCSVIQNLFHFHGFAPRVYDIVWLDPGECWAQVTGYLNGEVGGGLDRQGMANVQICYGLETRWDMNEKNFINGQLVDFQPWRFRDEGQYVLQLVKRAHRYAAWGSREEPYQTVEGMFKGQRSLERLGIREVNFDGKTVLDIGCNLGMTCVDAWRNGATRVTGVDTPEVIDVAREVCNITGEWAIDFVGANLPAERDKLEPADILLLLSAKQVKPFPWVFDLCRETMLFEGHVPDREETYRGLFEEHFSEVEFLGMSRDHGPRPVFRCWK